VTSAFVILAACIVGPALVALFVSGASQRRTPRGWQ
jgi:hypothetical protein